MAQAPTGRWLDEAHDRFRDGTGHADLVAVAAGQTRHGGGAPEYPVERAMC
jgi:hypothetical protein